MRQPFYEAANAVIQMYAWRQERPTIESLAHSENEINCAVTQLMGIASAAAYAGSNETARIKELALFWKRNKHLRITPSFIPLENTVVPA
ncbi:hypothetical protein FCH33_13545 [Serratia fonticola]|uniref:hypothetical protein n=1 Tax=Serratia fonticola TaxID=47917 RepID=UPI00157752BB|nr:hypothetical protein [Serratia fonticola]NTY87805.1 hypothetical protein [Serratia fonticola]NTZ13476.1 hypothetical protein [Serratia fonticola]